MWKAVLETSCTTCVLNHCLWGPLHVIPVSQDSAQSTALDNGLFPRSPVPVAGGGRYCTGEYMCTPQRGSQSNTRTRCGHCRAVLMLRALTGEEQRLAKTNGRGWLPTPEKVQGAAWDLKSVLHVAAPQGAT